MVKGGKLHPHLIGLPSSPLATFSFDDVLYYLVGHLKSGGEQFDWTLRQGCGVGMHKVQLRLQLLVFLGFRLLTPSIPTTPILTP